MDRQVKEFKSFLESIKHLDEDVVGTVLEAVDTIFEAVTIKSLINGGAESLPKKVLAKKLEEIGKTMDEFETELAKVKETESDLPKMGKLDEKEEKPKEEPTTEG